MIFYSLTNILAIFYDYINKIVAEKLNNFVIVYLKNIFLYTKNKEKDYIKAIQ